jgi:tRNA-intron lyase
MPKKHVAYRRQSVGKRKQKRANRGDLVQPMGKAAVKRPRSADAGSASAEGNAERPVKIRKTDENGMFGVIASFVLGLFQRLLPSRVPDVPCPSADDRLPDDEDEVVNEAAEAVRRQALRDRAFLQARSTAVAITATDARPGERERSTMALRVHAPRGISSERLAMRAAVFRDLYHKGYYMSCGAKFGADFLAYAGEPLLYHAALAVIVVDADDPVSPHDLVALGRLGDSTKKRTVLAYVDDEKIGYVGVQWEETLP